MKTNDTSGSEWAIGCRSARKGIWTSEFRDIINSRIPGNQAIANALSDDRHAQILSSLNDKPYVPIVTPSNLQRLAFINAVTRSRSLPTGHYPVRLIAKISASKTKSTGGSSTLTPEAISRLMTSPDSDFARLPPFIDYIIGMPVMVTHNISKQDGIVNGTASQLHSIAFPEGTDLLLITTSIWIRQCSYRIARLTSSLSNSDDSYIPLYRV